MDLLDVNDKIIQDCLYDMNCILVTKHDGTYLLINIMNHLHVTYITYISDYVD